MTHGLGRVLVVDDDEVIRRLIAVNLQLEGFDVETAVDGQDCLDRVSEIDPDVITLDVMMPRLDGWETAVQLRKSPETAHIKVVLITARAQEDDKSTAGRVGADAYLTKPFDPNEMIRVVRELAGRSACPARLGDHRRAAAGDRRRGRPRGCRPAAPARARRRAATRPACRSGSAPDPRAAAAPWPPGSATEPWIAPAEVTGPGYLTVTVTHDTLARLAMRIAEPARPAPTATRCAGRTVPAPRPAAAAGLAAGTGGPRRRADRPPRRRRGCHH